MKPAFQLSEHDKQSPQWVNLLHHLEDRLSDLRKKNDNPGNTETETAQLRGQIAEVKRLIALCDTYQEVTFPQV